MSKIVYLVLLIFIYFVYMDNLPATPVDAMTGPVIIKY